MTIIHSPRMLSRMTDPVKDQRAWLEEILGRLGVTATELARRAELNPSTLTRFLSPDGREGHTLSTRTIRKIENAVRLEAAAAAPAATLNEPEATFVDEVSGQNGSIRAAIAAIKGGRNGVDAWRINTDDLENIRLFRGDVVIVDLNIAPQAGDLVCVQRYSQRDPTGAETVFRLYEPPYVLSGALVGRNRRPDVVDQANVLIRGVVIARLSPRSMLHPAA